LLSALDPGPHRPGVVFAVAAVVAALGTVLAAAYLLRVVRRLVWGTPVGPALARPTVTEWVAWAPLLAGTLLLGVWPAVVLGAADPVTRLLTGLAGGAP
jgi:NADH-quinone oxidoreductase subunit M